MGKSQAKCSDPKRGYTWVINEIFYDKELDSLAKLLYCIIASFCWTKSVDEEKKIWIRNPCTASQKKLAELSGMCVKSVYNKLRLLRENGYIYWNYRGIDRKTLEIHLVNNRRDFLEDKAKRDHGFAEKMDRERYYTKITIQQKLLRNEISQEEYDEKIAAIR